MKRIFRVSSVAAALLATALAGSGVAWADGGRYWRDGHHGHRHHDRGHHYDRHYKPRGYDKGYRRGHGGKHHKHDDDDEEKLLIGLLMGGLVGYAMGTHQQSYDYGTPSYPPATAQPQVEAYPAPQYSYAPGGSSCLQEREYQTKVIIGGKQVDAYGTACLQPDGSWRRGPAQLVSY